MNNEQVIHTIDQIMNDISSITELYRMLDNARYQAAQEFGLLEWAGYDTEEPATHYAEDTEMNKAESRYRKEEWWVIRKHN